jgi:hypothetical protein
MRLATPCGVIAALILVQTRPTAAAVDAHRFLTPDETLVERRNVSLDGTQPGHVILLAAKSDPSVGVITRLSVIGWDDRQGWSTLGGGALLHGETPAHLGLVAVDGFASTQQIVLMERTGSGGYLRYQLYAFERGHIHLVLEREGLFQGSIRSQNGRLLEESGGVVREGSWSQDGFVFRVLPAGRPADDPDLVIVPYRVTDAGQVQAPATITLRLGQSLALVRGPGASDRQLVSGTKILGFRDGNYVAAGVGSTTITIIPNGYDWDKATEIAVVVVR